MRACGVRSGGGPVEVLDVPEPRQPGPGEVLIAVQTAGIGPWDGLVGTGEWDVGWRGPGALGVEGAGTVLALGADVADLAVGDAVLTHAAPLPAGVGLWGERAVVTAAQVARRPVALDVVLAGGLPVSGLTALQALDRLGVGSGTRLLVTGASGPTAAVALQLAARRGADVVATAGSRSAERLRALGARQVVDSHTAGWGEQLERTFDAALVAVAGTAAVAITLVRDGGQLCSITSDAPAGERGIDAADLYVRADGGQLGQLAVEAAEHPLALDTRTVALEDAPAVAEQVIAGRSGGVKHVLTFV